MHRGNFITVEGIEGCGKSTLIRALSDALIERGLDVISTREPGDGPLGPAIRHALLNSGSLDRLTETFLFLADRIQHCRELVRPALESGRTVLCDRFVDSTLAYQGYGRGLDVEQLREFNAMATDGLVPDLTLLLDLDVRAGLERARSRRDEQMNRIDNETVEFHERVRAGFLAEAENYPDRFAILDAGRSADDVLASALDVVESRLKSPA